MPQGRPRDTQRQRLYSAEDVLAGVRASRYAIRHLTDTQPVAGWVEFDKTQPSYQVQLTGPGGTDHGMVTTWPRIPMKVPTVDAVAAYLDAMQTSAWFLRRWGWRGLSYENGRGSHSTLYGYRITVAQRHRRTEAVILHEVAHTLTGNDCQDHGPEFAAILLELVRGIMGPEHAATLRASFREHRVRVARGWVPKPDEDRYRRALPRAERHLAARRQDARALQTAAKRQRPTSIKPAGVRMLPPSPTTEEGPMTTTTARSPRTWDATKAKTHTCDGACGKRLPAQSFPTTGKPGVRGVVCRKDRDAARAQA